MDRFEHVATSIQIQGESISTHGVEQFNNKKRIGICLGARLASMDDQHVLLFIE
jgi:hypothetical protein